MSWVKIEDIQPQSRRLRRLGGDVALSDGTGRRGDQRSPLSKTLFSDAFSVIHYVAGTKTDGSELLFAINLLCNLHGRVLRTTRLGNLWAKGLGDSSCTGRRFLMSKPNKGGCMNAHEALVLHIFPGVNFLERIGALHQKSSRIVERQSRGTRMVY